MKSDKTKQDELEKEELTEEADAQIKELDDSAEQNGEDLTEPVIDEVEKVTNQLKRALADYQNLEKRISGEKAAWIMTANRDLILRLLPGLDSLLLAEKHTEDQGVKMSIKHFMDIFEADGVKKIDTTGKDFDPNLMEAVTTADGEEGKVVEEVKAGYTLNGEVIRPAQVIVGKK